LDGRLVWATGEQRVLEALVPRSNWALQDAASVKGASESRKASPGNLWERLLNTPCERWTGCAGVERVVQTNERVVRALNALCSPMNALCRSMSVLCEHWTLCATVGRLVQTNERAVQYDGRSVRALDALQQL
jgi:hypothetical protein